MLIPQTIKLRKQSNVLELVYHGSLYQLSAEFLRVYSPSAEVQGHGNPILQYGKKYVKILSIQPAGQYALKVIFDDGHDTGLYTWDYFYHLATHKQQLWQDYLEQLSIHGKFRDPHESTIRIM